MLTLGMGIVFAGYSVGSYGWVLLQGWDIPLRSWVSPLHPFVWPSGDPPTTPPNKLFPSSKTAGTGTTAASGSGSKAKGGAPKPAGPPKPQPRGKSVLP